jgi:hypothetical protein
MQLCVPVTQSTDCNGVNGNTKAPWTTTVKHGRDFQLLVADDPSYQPNLPSWDGDFRISVVSGPCSVNGTAGDDTSDVPPHYNDANPTGVGPNAEYDISTTKTGQCVIKISEDPRYITDNTSGSISSNPPGRSATITVMIQKPSGASRRKSQERVR